MIKRTLYFGNPAYLHKKDRQLKVIDPETEREKASIPMEDIAVVVLDHPQLTLTHALMSDLVDRNVALISCDSRHMPSGLMLPLDGNHVQTERFRLQINASEPLLKNLWAQTIKAKIENQAALLKRLNFDNKRLLALIPQIKSGDPDNIEGRAASVYWKILFEEHDFTRDRFGVEPNSHLNYCYAILRAVVARALVSSGLLPTLGIFHRNKYNAYCLADDIMEPYRPFCDELVYGLFVKGEIESEELTREHKARLLSIASCDVLIDGKKSPLMVAMSRTTNSLFECFEGTRRKIVYPEFADD
ncbi:MAG: subtype II CRISPR-associated endonuclease Cas1 [Bacteroidetes bacterium GWF2_42_66]|nr:MAG: subtype II CRISPR-associated endonuclease Cas1 [Bacteroidetes bacterium GWA2_42_15]OFX98483.1 MAG: subtype II CRISPR-associated endonuclease Cas1 [Bacteroidetes bacterium GWE2_42_39]OFY42868.1 MAG: subtype II CRISPR-associated endonuclease Cas1 [Bacteroidetes bacterium GWF2_42_66]HBL74497.1 type II CRISPR-associated endonuclease Cas1 [Prolixibacteraceae bacterium]HCR89035.1 type II CRISPR-associated endonuclease Cas1 [Prolixibacteraceae bacterium]